MGYSREILLTLLSDASESLEQQQTHIVMDQATFSKICDLVNKQYLIASHLKMHFMSELMMQKSEKQILSILKIMHVSVEFRAHFILDLLNRAKKFLTLIAKESEDLVVELQQFRSREKEDKVDICQK